jgi:hypothetical protein
MRPCDAATNGASVMIRRRQQQQHGAQQRDRDRHMRTSHRRSRAGRRVRRQQSAPSATDLRSVETSRPGARHRPSFTNARPHAISAGGTAEAASGIASIPVAASRNAPRE